MNDIYCVSDLFNTVIYADDTTLSSILRVFGIDPRSSYSSQNINYELKQVNEWLKLNKLSLNIGKSKFMIFHTPQRRFQMPTLEIDGIQIERVEKFNFLGIILDKHLNWHEHIAHISNKISRTIGILNKLKHYIPENIKLLLYNSLILAHLNYGVLAWGYNHERLSKLQKKAIRIITLSKYNAHTSPLFKSRKLLKIQDIFKLQQFKFYYKYVNKKLPAYFQEYDLLTNESIHNYNTRTHSNIHVRRTNHEFAKRCIRRSIVGLINHTDGIIKNKAYTHSLYGFSSYVKVHLIREYEEHCNIINCYVCSRN